MAYGGYGLRFLATITSSYTGDAVDLKQEEELRETLGNRWDEDNARDRVRDTPSPSIYSGFGYFPKTPLDT